MFEMRSSKGGKRQEIEDLLVLMKGSKESNILIEKLKNYKPEQAIFQEIYKIIDMKALVSSIELLLREFEGFLKGGPCLKTFFELMEEEIPFIMKIKVWSSFNKFRMHLLRQSSDGLNLEIFMKNGFETHGKINEILFILINFWYFLGYFLVFSGFLVF